MRIFRRRRNLVLVANPRPRPIHLVSPWDVEDKLDVHIPPYLLRDTSIRDTVAPQTEGH